MSQILIPLFAALLLSACWQNGKISASSNHSKAKAQWTKKVKQ
jgi:outer membrane biogenesis lipoprotein LolB